MYHCVHLLVYGNAPLLIPPASTKSKRGYTDFTLSVCPSVCPSVYRIVSALYLQQYSPDPFHICTSYQATSEGVSHVMFVSKFKNLKFWQIRQICNFDFVFFWLGIQYESIVWNIIRRWGVSSELRRSSCSNCELDMWCDMLLSYCVRHNHSYSLHLTRFPLVILFSILICHEVLFYKCPETSFMDCGDLACRCNNYCSRYMFPIHAVHSTASWTRSECLWKGPVFPFTAGW